MLQWVIKITQQRIVQGILKTAQQGIMSRAIMMFLDMKLTILMSQLGVYVETKQLMLQFVIKVTQQKIV